MDYISKLFDITGRVAIVTGASSGLGVTFAKGLSQAGATVVLAARRLEKLEALEEEIRSGGGKVLSIQCDVAKEEDVKALVDETCRAYGKIDILVNNAGIANVSPAEDEETRAFETVMKVNVTGAFMCAKYCGRKMLEAGKGSIVNIASIMGKVGSGSIPQASYNASKGAVINLTREMAAQWARKGVRVNALSPGYFKSEMTGEMFEDDRSLKYLERKTPMGRTGSPEELMGALLLLVSDAGSYVTGQSIYVDGGWTII